MQPSLLILEFLENCGKFKLRPQKSDAGNFFFPFFSRGRGQGGGPGGEKAYRISLDVYKYNFRSI